MISETEDDHGDGGHIHRKTVNAGKIFFQENETEKLYKY